MHPPFPCRDNNETLLPVRGYLAIVNDYSCEVTDHGGAHACLALHLAASYDALALTSLSGLESFPLGSNVLIHVFVPPPGFTRPVVGPSCATHLLSCLEQSSLDVVPDILSGPISYSCRRAHMQVEGLLEMIAGLRVFKLPNFEARGELALGFWWHIDPHVAYKKLMLQGYFLASDHFYISDKFAHGPSEKDEVYMRGYVS